MKNPALEPFNDALVDQKHNIYCPKCKAKLSCNRERDKWFCVKSKCDNEVIYTIAGKVREE